jgi:Fungal specific transcription factor domain
VGQSIGLHVEDSLKRSVTSLSLLEQETMRRTWYSMYVLDRLLALQLGRPVAIHEDEYSMNLPSKAELPEETAGDISRGDPANQLGDGLSALDYFHSVVKFSRIVGQVISDLYRPSQLRMDPDQMLLSTATLDEKLLEWKLDLPRHLRFDLGHTFEKSLVFRRQVRSPA